MVKMKKSVQNMAFLHIKTLEKMALFAKITLMDLNI